MYKGDEWTSYEDARSVGEKAKLSGAYDLGGVMIWNIRQDDYKGFCGPKQALLKAINFVI